MNPQAANQIPASDPNGPANAGQYVAPAAPSYPAPVPNYGLQQPVAYAPQPMPQQGNIGQIGQSMPIPVGSPVGNPIQIPTQPFAPPTNYAPVAPTVVTQPVASTLPSMAAPQGAAVKPKTNPNSTQNALSIAEIRDGIVIMNDGSFRSVVMVKSINFDLMSSQEQESVEYSYQGFLNSLYFPIQIFIRSQKVDLQPYIDKLDKIRTEHDNMLLALLMDDYIDYIDHLSQQTNIMDKKFYIVIPYFPTVDVQKALTQSKNFFGGLSSMFSSKEQHVTINEADLEKAKTELRNRVQAVLGGLLQCGVQGLPLDTQELIELYYDTYNPDTATRQQLKNFNDLTADIITKGQGAAPQAHLQRELQ
jgi:hypothetical protein